MRVAVVVPGQGAYAPDGAWRITARCRQLVEAAELLAVRLDATAAVFTGWAPRGGPSEAEQMCDAWRGPEIELVVEPQARITAENASLTLPLLVEREIDQAVVVCTHSHTLRAFVFFRRIYAAGGIDARIQPVSTTRSARAVGRELVSLPLLPTQLRAARRRGAGGTSGSARRP